MKKVKFFTLGCKVNQYESHAMESLFLKAGYDIAQKGEWADVCVINTCTVTGVSDKKSRQIIRRAKRENPKSVLAAVGCLAQVAPDALAKIEEIDVILGTSNKGEIVKAVEAAAREKVIWIPEKTKEFESLWIDSFSERTRAFIKIQDGCDRYCSYCIIPYARGPVRSRPMDEVCREIEGLAQKGYCEFVLTGIHVASYGRNSDDDLITLLQRVSDIDGVKRIRLSSLEPLAFTDGFIGAIAKLPKVCPHFHLSLQSGSEKILKLMNRRYTPEMYAHYVAKIRESIPDAAITTDVITGFPGEGEAEFCETVDFVKQIKLSDIHVFPYSERQGTRAAEFDGRVDVPEREERARRLIAVAAQLRDEFVSKYIGREVEVLWEQKTRDGLHSGFTKNYIKVLSKEGETGAITRVTPTRTEKGELYV
ncbi:MAG: tRNA (N(6)-L-threonylcarbamoyladenosine(37)-C(2))-methylthiotransferase MtaB [Clostridia bacterium]|nr:tRNA (N(6)-L-threonylcarbamoyladenosine(37)-C(2))-methylthiotransferase MtaB [Clostridia bacterium]